MQFKQHAFDSVSSNTDVGWITPWKYHICAVAVSPTVLEDNLNKSSEYEFYWGNIVSVLINDQFEPRRLGFSVDGLSAPQVKADTRQRNRIEIKVSTSRSVLALNAHLVSKP